VIFLTICTFLFVKKNLNILNAPFSLFLHVSTCVFLMNCFNYDMQKASIFIFAMYIQIFENILNILTFFLGCLTSFENGSISRFVFRTGNESVV